MGGGWVATTQERDLWGKGQWRKAMRPRNGFGARCAVLCHGSSSAAGGRSGDSPIYTREPRAVEKQRGEALGP